MTDGFHPLIYHIVSMILYKYTPKYYEKVLTVEDMKMRNLGPNCKY